MTDDLAIYLMYNDDETPPKATKVLGGMKITGSHLHKIDLGNKIIEIPSVSYVKLLEDQIRELRYEIKKLEQRITKTNRIDHSQNNKIQILAQRAIKK